MALTKVIGDGTGTIDNLTVADAGTIGSASKTNAITIASSGLVQLTSTGIGAGSQVFQVIDDGATLFQIRSEDGNVSFPQAGAGIYLGVTSGTASNLLDDYEEGTFTPTLIDSGDALNASLSVAIGQYTKIGNLVNITISITVSSRTSTNNQVYIGGLPFTSSYSSTAGRAELKVSGSYINFDTGYTFVTARITHNETAITFIMNGDSVAQENFRGHDIGGSTTIFVSGAYYTS